MQRFWLALLVTLALHGVFQGPARLDRAPQTPTPQPTILAPLLSGMPLAE